MSQTSSLRKIGIGYFYLMTVLPETGFPGGALDFFRIQPDLFFFLVEFVHSKTFNLSLNKKNTMNYTCVGFNDNNSEFKCL